MRIIRNKSIRIGQRFVIFTMISAFVFSTFSPAISYAQSTGDDPAFYAGNDILTYSRSAKSCSATPAGVATAAPASITPEQKIAQTFVVGFDPTQTDAVSTAVKDFKIGGVFFNGEDFSKLNAKFFTDLNTSNGTPMFISADDEGGKVTRFAPSMPSAKDMGANMTASQIEIQGKKVADAMMANGANIDLAPVLDIQNPKGFMTIAERTWSTNPDVISEKAGAFARGLSDGGVKPVYKHFPGIGDLTQNTDKGKSASQSLKAMEDAGQLKPYKAIGNQNGAAVMLSNGYINEWGSTPVSINPEAIAYLHETIGFAGLITTDDLTPMTKYTNMSVPDAVAAAMNAGVDMPLFDSTDLAAVIKTVSAKVSTDKIEVAYQHAIKFRGGTPAASDASTDTSSATSGCCTAAGATTSIELTGKDNTEKILSFFMNNGLTLAQASGFIGNMVQESGLNPAAVQPSTTTSDPNYVPQSGTGFGLVQWTFPERQDPLVAFIKSKNVSMIDMGGQLGFVWQELNSPTWAKMLAVLKTETDPVEAAITIHGRKGSNIRGPSDDFRGYEESGDTPDAVRTVRGGEAKRVYDLYADKAPVATGVPTAAGTPTAASASGCAAATPTSMGPAVAAGDFVFYRQGDPQWGQKEYSGGSYAGNACGATSPAMVIATWKDKSINPYIVGEWIKANSTPYNANEMPKILANWGVKGELQFAYSPPPSDIKLKIDSALKSGNMVIVSGAGAKPFTSGGHFIVLRGITADGQYLIGDPAAPSEGTDAYNQKPWDPNLIYGASEFRSATIAIKP
ncbi:MAG: phage tail tip lysozyme [Candidatus Saccharimonadales bacterium]